MKDDKTPPGVDLQTLGRRRSLLERELGDRRERARLLRLELEREDGAALRIEGAIGLIVELADTAARLDAERRQAAASRARRLADVDALVEDVRAKGPSAEAELGRLLELRAAIEAEGGGP